MPSSLSQGKPSLPSLELDTGANTVTFDDERRRAPYQVPAGSFASVTFSGRVESWGEFLTREQALAVIGWLTVLVASEATDA